MDFILASSNSHKALEFSQIFDKKIVSIHPAELKVEVVEDGDTYIENACKKAKAYSDKFKKPVMSDDSGINIEALPGELGIHSARFGGDNLDFDQRMDLMLEKMKSVDAKETEGYYKGMNILDLEKNEEESVEE